MTDADKLTAIQEMCGMSWRMLAKKIGIPSAQRFTDIRSGRHGISRDLAQKLLDAFPQINPKWMYGNDETMLLADAPNHITAAYAGASGNASTVRGVSGVAIDEFFPAVEGAVRYTDSNMAEYPNGALLMLRRVTDMSLILPGQDYFVETADFSSVNRVQRGSDAEHIALYSTNTATYPDGRMMYEPCEVALNAVHGLYKVLGYMECKTSTLNI